MLVSGFAHATRLYDHIAAYRVVSNEDSEFSEFFNTRYIATYTVDNGGETSRYVGIFDSDLQILKTYQLRRDEVVNNLRSYYLHANDLHANSHVSFVATRGALYFMLNNSHPRQITEITPDYDVIDVLQTSFGFVVIADKPNGSGEIQSYLFNLKIQREHFEVSIPTVFKVKITSAASQNCKSSDGTPSLLYLARSDSHFEVLRAVQDDKWLVEKKVSTEKKFKLIVAPSDGDAKVYLLMYDPETKTSYYNNDGLETSTFQPISSNGGSSPNDFNYSVSEASLNGLIFAAESTREQEILFSMNQNSRTRVLEQTIMGYHLVGVSAKTPLDEYVMGFAVVFKIPVAIYLVKNVHMNKYKIYGVFANPSTKTYNVEDIGQLPE